MGHHGHIHVVERSQPDELRLARQELQRAVPPQLVPVPDLDILLGRHDHEGDAPRKLLHDTGRHEAHRNRHQRADLAVVAAGVGRPRLRVGVRMSGHDERVQFRHHGDRGTGPPGIENGLQAGHRDAVLERDGQPPERLGDPRRRLHLPEPGLGRVQYLLGQRHSLVPAAVYLGAGRALKLFRCHHAPLLSSIIEPRRF